MTLKLFILDRDGVINQHVDACVRTPDAWEALPGSLEAIAKINKAGLFVGVATNQSGVGRGYYSQEILDTIHQTMFDALKAHGGHIDHLECCPHHPNDGCVCRKPKPGMMLALLEHFNVSPEEAVVVGDSLCDIEAAHAAGIKAVLVMSGNAPPSVLPEGVDAYDDLEEVLEDMLAG